MREAGKARVVVLAILAVVAVGAVVAAAVLVLGGDDGDGPPGDGRAESPREKDVLAAATRFTEAVSRGRPGEGGTAQPADVVALEFQAAVGGLGDPALEVTAGAVAMGGEEAGDGGPGTATVPLSTRWTAGGASWTSRGLLTLVEGAGRWRARWALASLDDRLRAGDVLAAESSESERAAILDGAGQPLVAPTPVVHVGVVPQRATDIDGLAAGLARLLDIDAADLATRVRAAAPTAFVDVITLRRTDYEPLRAQLQPLPGTAFQEDTQLLAPTRSFARALLGTVGPATAEQVAASEGRLAEGDAAGQSGLQARYDTLLRGTPGVVVTVTRAPAGGGPGGPSSTTAPAEGTTETLEEVPGRPGTPVRTTLDVATQQAAEAALAGEGRVSALVAVRASTGEVLAVANGPTGTTSNVATTGRVPPGSTFKVVSTLAHLRRGLSVDQVVPCPATASVGGRSFRNAGGLALGEVPFRTDFARSCNTAFVGLAAELGPDDLTDAGRAFGLGVEVDAGVASYPGSVPPTEGPVDAAAASIGQGRLQASPLAMAGVAATVASGTWRAPRVVTEPAPAAVPEQPLGPGEADTLRALMRGVVTGGTGAALAGVPGGEVFAKTGTAEFGTEAPPRTHAWIIGFQGDVAFAVFVEGGESGSGVAAPLAARFLTELAGG
ncbi:MAG TPA: penicillin-binding transpeptidase domain-containing protein [Acidimicrobiales bacterium]|nr:penicillin-binding transpeptidase domain-containing protein [Acidimicrobiales bacterium]